MNRNCTCQHAYEIYEIDACCPVHGTPQRSIEAAVSVLRIQPGDVLVVTLPAGITMDCQARTRQSIEGAFPGTKVIYHTPDFPITVVRPEQVPSITVDIPITVETARQ